MAKKDKKSGKKDKGTPDPAVVVDAVRERGRGLLDDVTSAAQRIRESFDDLRVLEDVRALRAEVDALARRLAALERPGAGKPSSAGKPSAAAKPSASKPASKPAARKPAARKPAARKPAAAKRPAAKPRTSTRTRSSSAASASSGGSGGRPAVATRSTGARKPSGS